MSKNQLSRKSSSLWVLVFSFLAQLLPFSRVSAQRVDLPSIPKGYIILTPKPPPAESAKHETTTSLWDILVGIGFIFAFLGVFFLQ